jgi:type IV secretory pathway TraG/TraD family ATPase VirD4
MISAIARRKVPSSVRGEYIRAGKRLACGKDLSPLGPEARTMANRARHPFMADHPGLPWPVSFIGNKPLYQGWRECGLANLQPGGGKTSGFVIPQAAAAPGACVYTTNKWDGVREVIDVRARLGGKARIFDPMGILGVKQECYFDPLPYVRSDVDAKALANIIADADLANNSRTDQQQSEDAQWGSWGRKILQAAVLAAACERQTLAKVHEWVVFRGRNRPEKGQVLNRDEEGKDIIDILEREGHQAIADELRALAKITDRTRDGVWFTAGRMVQDLGLAHIRTWSTPVKGLDPIDLGAFLGSKDTLILASKKGTGGAGLLIMAIIHCLKDVGETLAGTSGGVLPVPLVMLLDEVCNIVAWPTLPDDLSYFGSLGIVVNLFIQGFDQAERIWGKAGVGQIVKNCNMRYLGGGESEPVARAYSAIIGEYNRKTVSTHTKGFLDSSESVSTQPAPVLTPSQIHSMPKGLGLFYAQEIPKPALAVVIGWHETHQAKRNNQKNNQGSKEPSIWTT